MLLLFGLVLIVFGVGMIVLMPMLWGREIHHQYAGARAVTCPETHEQVAVSIDATHAAVTGLQGAPEFRLADCTRWPARAKCAQDCLPEALRSEAYTKGEVQARERQISHLPVLLAAFGAWYVGMVWHSHYLFRERWMADLGLTPEQVKQLVAWYSPHLLSVAACLLFAYGVAWLQTWREQRGARQGVLSAVMLWTAIAVVTLPSTSHLNPDLLLLEGTYTLAAAIVAGAVIGGLSGRLVLPELEAR